MKTFDQKETDESAITCLESLIRRIETCDVRVTNIGQKQGIFTYGPDDSPQFGHDGTGALIVEYVNDKQAEAAALLRPEPAVYVPEPGAYDEGLLDVTSEAYAAAYPSLVHRYDMEEHVAFLKAEELAKVVKTLRDHAARLEDGTLTLDGFSLVKPAELVATDAGLARTFTGTGNLTLAYHDASARAAHLAHAEVVVD